MTVVVALSSADGVVIASDSQETSGATRTIVRKLFDVDGRLVWGGAGETAITERIAASHGQLIPHLGEMGFQVANQILALTRPLQQAALAGYVAIPNTQSPMLQALFCWWDVAAGLPRIYQVSQTGLGCFRTNRAAIGSGGAFAEVALASVGHLHTHELDLERLKMVAFKAIQDVIFTSSYGVGWPIQMYTITPDGRAQGLASADLNGVRDSVSAWLERQRAVLGELAEQPAQDEEPPEQEDGGDPGLDPDEEEAAPA